MHVEPVRSMLYVPGSKLSWVEKARQAGADAVILDLEDAVPSSAKESARREVGEYLNSSAHSDLPIFVRINDLSSSDALEDIRAVVCNSLTGVVVPKVSTSDDVRLVEKILEWTELDRSMETPHTLVIPLLETAQAIRNTYDLCTASDRIAYVGGLGVKGGDVERALGYRWTAEGKETLALRSNVLIDVRAAGTPSPVAGLWTDIEDLDGLRAFAMENRQLGYEGMVAIHPSHVETINQVFTPSRDELERDRRLVAAMDSAGASGNGAVIFEGEMIDEAMAETSRRRLRMYSTASNE